MKVLIVGTGSIGSRHLKNIAELGHEVYAVDINAESLQKASLLAAGTFSSLVEALRIKPDAVFICTFSNDHIIPALESVRAGCNLFIEKPLSLSLDGTEELVKLVKEKNLVSMVGCNMRFHPALRHIHNVLTVDPAFVKKLWANLEFGYYLPFAKDNYEASYMANRSMGGNLIFDDIHELDYAVWFMGRPLEVFCTKGIRSDLKIDTEDDVDMIIRFESGAVCTVHMDYLQHGYSRRCKIVCNDGTICWDFAYGKVGSITAVDRQWRWVDMEFDISYNKMYMDEAGYFLECASEGKHTFNTVEQSLAVLKLAMSAERSCSTGRWEKI